MKLKIVASVLLIVFLISIYLLWPQKSLVQKIASNAEAETEAPCNPATISSNIKQASADNFLVKAASTFQDCRVMLDD